MGSRNAYDVPADWLLGLQAAEHGAQAPRRVVAVALGVTWRLDGAELAEGVVVVLALGELADENLRGSMTSCGKVRTPSETKSGCSA